MKALQIHTFQIRYIHYNYLVLLCILLIGLITSVKFSIFTNLFLTFNSKNASFFKTFRLYRYLVGFSYLSHHNFMLSSDSLYFWIFRKWGLR